MFLFGRARLLPSRSVARDCERRLGKSFALPKIVRLFDV